MTEKRPGGGAPRRKVLRRILSSLGPGLVGGAADDDPSGIATYSVAGAELGTAMLWTAIVTWPLMSAVQMMCARIGMVTGEGLGSALRKKLPRWMVVVIALALLVANTINIGADLAGMADAAEMLTGAPSHVLVMVFGGLIAWATIRFTYTNIARILRWLTLSLFAYVATAFIVGADWGQVARDTFLPSMPKGSEFATLVAILGTTISPYLFFWQASQEVEEEKGMGRMTALSRRGATRDELVNRRVDVGIGTLFSNAVMFFVILTTALTLHRHGDTHVETSRQAAEALRPLAGRFASLLYTLGLIGVGFLAIPTLSGSAAYALAETFDWKQGLNERAGAARPFYAVIALSTVAGIALDFTGVNPVRALFYSAVVNGVLAPFLLVAILLIASDVGLMQKQPSSRLSIVVVAITTLVMFGACIGMFAV